MNQSDFTSWNSAGGNAQAGASVTQTQLRASTGLVKVAGFEVTPDVAATLSETAPELVTRVRGVDGRDEYLTVDPAAKAAEAAKEADNAKDEEAARIELNRFVDDAAEGVMMHLNADVDFGDRTRFLIEMTRDGVPSEATLKNIAQQLHMSVDDTVEALNAVHTNMSFQLAAVCGANGVDAQAFSAWAKADRSSEMFKALQVHSNDRNVEAAWTKLVTEFKARGGVR